MIKDKFFDYQIERLPFNKLLLSTTSVDLNNILFDFNLFPIEIKQTNLKLLKPQTLNVALWINTNISQRLLNNINNGSLDNFQSVAVKNRIAINMIDKLPEIWEFRRNWQQWLIELLVTRRMCITDFYYQVIKCLPF